MLRRGEPVRDRTWRPEDELWDDLRGSSVLHPLDCFDSPDYFSEQTDEYDPDFVIRSGVTAG